jgi:acetamidase/formamidase
VVDLDFGKINPVSGPIYVDGAKPGDVLKVTLEGFQLRRCSTARASAGRRTSPASGFWPTSSPIRRCACGPMTQPAWNPALWGKSARVPLKPFSGTIGNAPAEAGLHSVVPPRRVGGNLDIRDLTAGVTLYLPVEVEGALFSVGDTHAAQGDGEVCGTAIESPMNVVLTLDLVKDQPLKTPRFTTPGPVTRHLDAKGYEATTGIGPDLMKAAKDAVSGMVDLLQAQQGLSAVDAYMLCSVCGDLRISEVVDMPNWVVSFYFPRVVFE